MPSFDDHRKDGKEQVTGGSAGGPSGPHDFGGGDEEVVEFLDDDLVIMEATGEVHVGEISTEAGEEDLERTAVSSIEQVRRRRRVEFEEEEDDGFLDRPTAEVALPSRDQEDAAREVLAVDVGGAPGGEGGEEEVREAAEVPGPEPDAASRVPAGEVEESAPAAEPGPEHASGPGAREGVAQEVPSPETGPVGAQVSSREQGAGASAVGAEAEAPGGASGGEDAEPPAEGRADGPSATDVQAVEEWELAREEFAQQAHRLALKRRWEELADLTRRALAEAPWARQPAARAGLLADLGRVCRDRLGDLEAARESYEELLKLEPGSREATEFLEDYYERQARWEELYDLLVATARHTWDPAERLARTRRAAEIGLRRLASPERAALAWESLWEQGDRSHEVRSALVALYRDTKNWTRLARFLLEGSEELGPPERRLQQRQVLELCLYGSGDLDMARRLSEELLSDAGSDAVTYLAKGEVLARAEDWEGLYRLMDEVREVVSEESLLSLMRLAAKGLWTGGRKEEATSLYRRILDMHPEDDAAFEAVEQALGSEGAYEELLRIVEVRLDAIEDEEVRLGLFAKAAKMADEALDDPDRAVDYWKRCAEAMPERIEPWEALAELYEKLQRWEELAEALHKQVELRRDPSGKRQVLARLGRLYSNQLEDDERARVCWQHVLVLDPSDGEARAELMAIHRRRGEFEELDRALQREIAMAESVERALDLCKEAAQNLEEHFEEPERTLLAYFRVLDLAPRDRLALEAIVRILAEDWDRRGLFGERRAEAADTQEERKAAWMDAAQALEEQAPVRAASLYERILRLDPKDIRAAEALCRLYLKQDKVDWAYGVAEFVCLEVDDPDLVARFLRTVAPQFPEGTEKYRLYRRVALLGGDPEVLDELEKLARAVSAWEDYLELLDEVAAQAPERAAELKTRAARVCREELGDRQRALAELLCGALSPAETRQVLNEMESFAEDPEAAELFVAACRAAARGAEPQQRAEFFLRGAKVLLERLDAPLRAFLVGRRATLARPEDQEAWKWVGKVAEDHELWESYVAFLAEVLPGVSDSRAVELVRERHDISLGKLGNRQGALLQLVLTYRLWPKAKMEQIIAKATKRLKAWDLWLPILEANRWLAADQRAQGLAEVAKLHREKRKDAGRFQDLVGFALEIDPSGSKWEQELLDAASETGRWLAACDHLRLAAAQSGDRNRAIALYVRAADLAREHGAEDLAAEIHARIATMDPTQMGSVEACLEWSRKREDHDALVHWLTVWIENAPEDADRVPRYLELAELAAKRGQPEQALLAYTKVLELAPDNEVANEAVRSMEDKLTPEQRLRMLKAELARLEGAEREARALEVARLQEEVLGDSAGAADTLLGIEDVLGGEAHGVLVRLLTREGRWADLAEYLEKRADQVGGVQEKLEELRQALAARIEHLGDTKSEAVERLCRKVLALDPDDDRTLVLLTHNFRSQQRYRDLVDQLESVARAATDPWRRYWALSEMGRTWRWGLEDSGEAASAYRLLEDLDMGRRTARLALAEIAWEQERWSDYIRWRRKELDELPKPLASLGYCHLGEVADRHLNSLTETIALYRRARILDESNDLAKNALKALGRRLKDWREGAVLLPGAPSDLGRRELAEALLEKFKAEGGGREAAHWLDRALVVDPGLVAGWDAKAELAAAVSDWEAEARARWEAFQAFERATAPNEALREEVARVRACADAFRRAGREDWAKALEKRAHALSPEDLEAVLAVAVEAFEAGHWRQAARILGDLRTRSDFETLPADIRADVGYRLGVALLKLGEPSRAMEAFTSVVELEPLHAGALENLGQELAAVGRQPEAARAYLRALVVEHRSDARAQTYSALGVLFEDAFGRGDEAGACYRLALGEGTLDLETMWRALRRFQADGSFEEAEELAGRMLELREDSEDLAELWVVRGQIHMAAGRLEEAAEAFDMALSYDPTSFEALQGLARVLEARGEWDQLLDVLEATQELLRPEERVQTLLKMADIARDRFGDQARYEGYLKVALEVSPTREVLERLLEVYGEAADRVEEREKVLSGLVRVGPPYFPHVFDLGRLLVAEGRRRWAWAILSPFSEVRKVDREFKSMLREMRKEFDGAEVPVLTDQDYESKVRHPDHVGAVQRLVALLEERYHGWRQGPEAVAGREVSKVGERTGLGRVLTEVSASLGLSGARAWRAEGMDRATAVAWAEEGPQVLVEAEFARRLVQNEVRFVFGHALELCRPGNWMLAVGGPALRKEFFEALRASLSGGGSGELFDSLREVLEAEPELAGELESIGWLGEAGAEERYWRAVETTARRVGLLMAGELHLALRALERMAGEKTSLQVDTVADLDGRLEHHPEWADLVAWAATPEFEALLQG